MPVSNAILHLFLAFWGALLGLPFRPCSGHFPAFFLHFFRFFAGFRTFFPHLSMFSEIFSIVSSYFPFFLPEHTLNAKLHLVLAFLERFSRIFPGFLSTCQACLFLFPAFLSTFQALFLYFSRFSQHFSAGSWPGGSRRAPEEDVFS